jgi:hypothetical protein
MDDGQWQYLTWPFGSGELKNDEKRAITPVNLITHLEVIALFFYQIFKMLILFILNFKNYKR